MLDVTSQVSQANYQHYMEDMLFAHLGDDRGANGRQHDLAMTNIYNHFKSVGLGATIQTFTRDDGGTGSNIVAVKPGTLRSAGCLHTRSALRLQ